MVFSIVLAVVSLISAVAAMPAGTIAAPAPASTETLGWAQHWIHTTDKQFLQAAVPWTATDAVVGSSNTAGEFNIVSTSLVDTVHTPNFLFATVEPATPGATMLKVSFGNGAIGTASGGDFAWTGTPKTLTWSRSDSKMTGWITCENNVLYANLASTVPAGCTSVTLTSSQTQFASQST